MRSLFSRFFSKAAPEACSECDGGSGTIFTASDGTLSLCNACAGKGLAFAPTSVDDQGTIIDLAAIRAARAKSQHTGRKAA